MVFSESGGVGVRRCAEALGGLRKSVVSVSAAHVLQSRKMTSRSCPG